MDKFEPGDLLEFNVPFLHNGNEFYLVLEDFSINGIHRWIYVYDLSNRRIDQFSYIEKVAYLQLHRARVHTMK